MATSEKFWNKVSEKYANSKISDIPNYERKLAETQKLFTPEMRVLEFGCGTGSTAIEHAPFVSHIDATDSAENMIQIARRKAIEAGVENITFTSTTLKAFAAADDSIDVVLGLNILHLMADWQDTLVEVQRILKPGGAFVSSSACLGDSPMRLIKLITPLGKLLGLMPDVYVFKKAELAQKISDSGFEIESQWCHGKPVESCFIVARKAY